MAANIPAPSRRGLSQRAGWFALAGMSVLLLVVAALAWQVLGRAGGPSRAELQAAADTWLQQHQTTILEQDACLRNFDYRANPVYVNALDQGTQSWLAVLVKAGIYTAPVPVQSGFMQQMKYTWGPQAAHYLRNGALCVADGLRVEDVRQVQPGRDGVERLPPGVSLPQNWAMVRLTLQWSGLPAWAQQPPVSTQLNQLSAPLQQTLLLRKTPQGWVLPSQAEEMGMRAQLSLLSAGGAFGQAVQQLGNQLGQAAQSLDQNTAPPAAQQPAPWSGFVDWIKNLLSFGDPARRIPPQFYDDVQSGRFDAAYGLLGPDLQILGPEKMRAAFKRMQAQILAKGGVADVTIVRVTDQGGVKVVRYTVHFRDGSAHAENMRIGKVGDRWFILSIEGV
ncbi:MAG: hypothetical protein ACP5F9_07510 [Thiomonas sp.]